MPYPISLQLYTVRNQLKADYFGTIRKIAEIGYAAIEGGVPAGTTPKEYKKILDDLGLKISSGWAWPTAENIGAILEQAHLFGYKHLINGFMPEHLKTSELIQESACKLKESANLLAEHGLQFCMHNHAWEFDDVDGRRVYDVLLESGWPNLASELDIYWASNFGKIDVPAVIKQYHPRIPLLHVKDGPLVKNEPNTAVGSGKLDIKACIDAADPAVLQYLVVELDSYVGGEEHVLDAVRDSYQWLTQNGLGVGHK